MPAVCMVKSSWETPWQSPPYKLFVFFWLQTFTLWGRETNERNLTSRTGNVGCKVPRSAMYNTSAWNAPAEYHYFMCCRCYITCCGGHSIWGGGSLSACGCQILHRIDRCDYMSCATNWLQDNAVIFKQVSDEIIFSQSSKQLRVKG